MKILINRTDAIGDSLLSLPVCEVLRKKYPSAQIVYLASSRCGDMLELIGAQDDSWVIDRKQSSLKLFFHLLKKIRTFSPDVYIHLGGTELPSLICFLLWVPKRLGIISKAMSWLCLNLGVRQKRTQMGRHEVEMNLEVLAPLGIGPEKVESLTIRRDLIHADALKLVLAEKFLDGRKVIFVHPGMTGHTLNWPVENYVLLLSELEQRYPETFQFVLSYTPSDAQYIERFQTQLKQSPLSNLFYFNGAEQGLRHYIECLSQADLFIGPSTGTTHIANVLSVPTIAFYSPIKAQHASRWSPYFGDEHKLIIHQPLISCPERVKCRGTACEHYFCMDKMTVGQAIKSVQQTLQI